MVIKCNHCQAELDMLIAVKEEVNLYALTLQGDEEFYETQDSDVIEYLCPKCFGILNNDVVIDFRDIINGSEI